MLLNWIIIVGGFANLAQVDPRAAIGMAMIIYGFHRFIRNGRTLGGGHGD